MIKDYNGQSYWFSFNISSFLKSNNNFPKWLNADLGIGADGMTGAINNPDSVNGKPIPQFIRQRKLFVGIDEAFNKKNELPFPAWMNMIRIPSPVLQWKTKTNQVTPRALYY
jgi:hypothetical protein